jgi:hypothetical protein
MLLSAAGFSACRSDLFLFLDSDRCELVLASQWPQTLVLKKLTPARSSHDLTGIQNFL